MIILLIHPPAFDLGLVFIWWSLLSSLFFQSQQISCQNNSSRVGSSWAELASASLDLILKLTGMSEWNLPSQAYDFFPIYALESLRFLHSRLLLSTLWPLQIVMRSLDFISRTLVILIPQKMTSPYLIRNLSLSQNFAWTFSSVFEPF